jgi:hypothetical protein
MTTAQLVAANLTLAAAVVGVLALVMRTVTSVRPNG